MSRRCPDGGVCAGRRHGYQCWSLVQGASLALLVYLHLLIRVQPQGLDWNTNFPDGWHAEDVQAATERAFNRIPWTDIPSSDGILYNPEAYNLISRALASNGWSNVTANNQPDSKNRTFSLSEYFFLHGERGGPMETYLVSAASRNNFRLWLNTTVTRVDRSSDTITGVQVEGDNSGTVKLAEGGRVILSAGVFGTAKILFRSEPF